MSERKQWNSSSSITRFMAHISITKDRLMSGKPNKLFNQNFTCMGAFWMKTSRPKVNYSVICLSLMKHGQLCKSVWTRRMWDSRDVQDGEISQGHSKEILLGPSGQHFLLLLDMGILWPTSRQDQSENFFMTVGYTKMED